LYPMENRNVERAIDTLEDALTSAPSTPLGTNVALTCAKCGEETTFGKSTALGARNPLKRVGNECAAIDRALNRRCGGDSKKARTDKTDAQSKSEAEHKALKEKVKQMSEADRQTWYKEKKETLFQS
jgi:hypothetical protein